MSQRKAGTLNAQLAAKAGRVAGLQYVGLPGVTQECVDAVEALLCAGPRIMNALLLTHDHRHGFLLTVGAGERLAVQTGFASGYRGEGPSGLSRVLSLLGAHRIPVHEVEVTKELITRLENTALTLTDIERIEGSRLQSESKWREYVYEEDEARQFGGSLWKYSRSSVPMPFSLIEPRLFDLARDFFDAPDACLMSGYRRLEDAVRKRTGIDDHSTSLFASAFLNDQSPLTWKDRNSSECKGRAQLFVGAYMAFRNPRAHRENRIDSHAAILEFLLLNQLYLLESEAVERAKTPSE